ASNPNATTTATTRTPAVGLLVEDVPLSGEYTYTFPTADVQQTDTSGAPNGVVFTAVAYDASKLGNTHVVWIEASRQTNLDNTLDPAGFDAVDTDFNYIPNNPTRTPLNREIAKTAGSSNFHPRLSAYCLSLRTLHDI